MVPNVKTSIVVMNDPWKYWVLGEVIVRAISHYVDKVEILDIGDLPIGPHIRNIIQLDLDNFFPLITQVTINPFPHRLVIEHKQ